MIVLDKLQKQYGRQKILQKITHTFASNSKTVILGSNGSGKSTLIKILSGALEASDNPPVFTINAKEIAAKEIGLHLTIAAPYVALNPSFTLKETLHFHATMCGFRPALRLEEWVSRAGLSKHEDKRLDTFSSGMLQRVRLLLAIPSNRSILLLDEPTSNLDKDGILFYQELIAQFTADKTVIVASNYFSEEYSFCNQDLLLEKHY